MHDSPLGTEKRLLQKTARNANVSAKLTEVADYIELNGFAET